MISVSPNKIEGESQGYQPEFGVSAEELANPDAVEQVVENNGEVGVEQSVAEEIKPTETQVEVVEKLEEETDVKPVSVVVEQDDYIKLISGARNQGDLETKAGMIYTQASAKAYRVDEANNALRAWVAANQVEMSAGKG